MRPDHPLATNTRLSLSDRARHAVVMMPNLGALHAAAEIRFARTGAPHGAAVIVGTGLFIGLFIMWREPGGRAGAVG